MPFHNQALDLSYDSHICSKSSFLLTLTHTTYKLITDSYLAFHQLPQKCIDWPQKNLLLSYTQRTHIQSSKHASWKEACLYAQQKIQCHLRELESVFKAPQAHVSLQRVNTNSWLPCLLCWLVDSNVYIHRKKARWYLEKELASVLPKEERAIKLNFEAKGDGHKQGDYMVEDRSNICVACGGDQYLTMHHVGKWQQSNNNNIAVKYGLY